MDQWARVLSLQHWDLSLNPSSHTRDSARLNTCVTPAFRCRTEEGESWLARHRVENGNLQYSERSSPEAMFQSQRMTQCPVLDSGPHAYSWVHTVTWTPHSPSTYTSTIFKTREMAQGVKYLCLNLQNPDKVRHMVAAVYNPNVVMVTWEAETRQLIPGGSWTSCRHIAGANRRPVSPRWKRPPTLWPLYMHAYKVFSNLLLFPSTEYKLVHFKKWV